MKKIQAVCICIYNVCLSVCLSVFLLLYMITSLLYINIYRWKRYDWIYQTRGWSNQKIAQFHPNNEPASGRPGLADWYQETQMNWYIDVVYWIIFLKWVYVSITAYYSLKGLYIYIYTHTHIHTYTHTSHHITSHHSHITHHTSHITHHASHITHTLSMISTLLYIHIYIYIDDITNFARDMVEEIKRLSKFIQIVNLQSENLVSLSDIKLVQMGAYETPSYYIGNLMLCLWHQNVKCKSWDQRRGWYSTLS